MSSPETDPRIERLAARLRSRSSQAMPRPAGTWEAAVALVLRAGPALELLMIQRVERADDPWSGHMALPGGRRGSSDSDLLDTALRETEEEVGIALRRDHDILGPLDEVAPRTARLPPLVIAPFVACAAPGTEPHADPREVAATVWIPLPALRRREALGEVLIELEGGSRAFPAFVYGGYRIWGLTHRIVSAFLELADEV